MSTLDKLAHAHRWEFRTPGQDIRGRCACVTVLESACLFMTDVWFECAFGGLQSALHMTLTPPYILIDRKGRKGALDGN